MKHILTITAALLMAATAAVAERAPDAPLRKEAKGQGQVPPWLHDRGSESAERPHLQKWLQHMKEKDPAEFERMQTLRTDDPEAFRQELRSRLQKKSGKRMGDFNTPRMGGPIRSDKIKALDKENWSLARKIKKADGAERDALIQQLQTSLEMTFDERESMRQQQLDQVKEELKRHESMAAKRKDNRDKIIADQLQRMLKPEKGQRPGAQKSATAPSSP